MSEGIGEDLYRHYGVCSYYGEWYMTLLMGENMIKSAGIVDVINH